MVRLINSKQRVGPYHVTLGQKTVALWEVGGRARVWDVTTGEGFPGVDRLTQPIDGVAINRAGEMLAVVTENGIVLWDLRTGKPAGPIEGKGFARFSPDGRWVVTGGKDDKSGESMLYVVGRTRLLHARLKGSSAPVAFDPSGKRMATAAAGGKIQLWDIESRNLLRTLDGHGARLLGLAFAPDGKTLVSVGGKTIKAWVVSTGEEKSAVANPDKWSGPTAFSPDGKYLIAGSGPILRAGAPMGVWDVASGKRLIDLRVGSANVGRPTFRPGAKDLASAIYLGSPETFTAFHAGGRFWVTGTLEGTPVLWRGEWDRPRPLATLVLFRDGGWAVIDPEGRYDGSRDGDVEGLHGVVGNKPVALEQFKERAYEPGLLAKLLGFNMER